MFLITRILTTKSITFENTLNRNKKLNPLAALFNTEFIIIILLKSLIFFYKILTINFYNNFNYF
jgi:hypothetical protein